MEQYIPKAAVVAEIEKRKKEAYGNEWGWAVQCATYEEIISLLDTFEVKEVDLEKELERLDSLLYDLDGVAIKGATSYLTVEDIKDIAKHFFELGLKAKVDDALVEEIYSHIDSIKDTADIMTSGNFMHHRAAIKFSANVIRQILELIGFKAQKGE